MSEPLPYCHKEVIGDCTLYLGDCRDVLPTLGKVDAVVTDPPYEFDSQGGGIFLQRRSHMNAIRDGGLDKGFDHSFLTAALCDSVICFCHNDQVHKLAPWFEQHFDRHVICSWHKENPMPVANKHYMPDTEFYFHAWNSCGYPIGKLTEKGRYVLHPVGRSEFGHPTEKPMPVMLKIMRNVNAETILDPFMGSGTTGVACVKLGRKFIGIEIDESYFNIACDRIRRAYAQPDFFVAPPAEKPKQEVMTL